MPSVMDTYVENREMVQPNHANALGTTHGGNVVRWMDEVGVMAAMRFSGHDCVTARMERVDFRRPISVGDATLIQAYVYDTGETSMRVRIRAFREDLKSSEREVTTESRFVYVAVDDEGTPVSVPELTAASDRGERLQREALAEEDS